MLQTDIDNLSIDDIRTIISESIKRGKGLISYRKHLIILKSIEMKLKMITEYRKSLVQDVDKEIGRLSESAGLIRDKIKEAIEDDDTMPKTETGGKSISLPDVATVSLSKEISRVVIEDAEKALKSLGGEFKKTIETLDRVKAANFALSNLDKRIPGMKTEQTRELRILFKR